MVRQRHNQFNVRALERSNLHLELEPVEGDGTGALVEDQRLREARA